MFLLTVSVTCSTCGTLQRGRFLADVNNAGFKIFIRFEKDFTRIHFVLVRNADFRPHFYLFVYSKFLFVFNRTGER